MTRLSSESRLAAYIRVSRVGNRQGASYISPDVQLDAISAWAERSGVVLDQVVREEDVSGAVRIDARKLGQLVARCEDGDLDGIVVYNASRFARNLAETAVAIERLDAAGARLVGVQDGIDTSTRSGRMMAGFVATIAEDQLAGIRESWRESHVRALRRGVHQSHVPFGYRRGGKSQPLQLDSARKVSAVVRAFELRAKGATLTDVAALLNRVDQECNWTTPRTKRMLLSRVYRGEVRFAGQVQKDAHLAIVTEAQWQAAQWSLEPPVRLRQSEGALLAGLLRCAGCSYCMKRTGEKVKNGGEPFRDYQCRRQHSSGVCPAPSAVRADLIEGYVVERFREGLPTGLAAEAILDTKSIEQATEVREEEETQLAELFRLRIKPAGHEEYQAAVDAQVERVEQAQRAERDALRDAARGLPASTMHADDFDRLPVEERRELLAGAIDAVMLRRGRTLDERVVVLWRGQVPEGLPTRGRVGVISPFAFPDDAPADAGVAAA